MGAIAGWVCGSGRAPSAHALVPMLEALAHRVNGDSLAACIDTNASRQVVLGTTLADAASRTSLAFDGAIVNRDALRKELGLRGYRFERKDDAELLLRAYQQWDKDVVKHLRGAFAFAVWDARKERLIVARDRFGEKPLYLHERDGALYFASEVKALVRLPGFSTEVDLGAVGDYLRLRYVPGPRTLLTGIRKLAPGSYALWQFGRLREIRYWAPPDKEGQVAKPPANPVAGFIERLDESVQLNMQTRAPIGALLSGGYDSAAIVALMRRHHEHVATFAAGFAEDRRSELPAAALMAKHLGTMHHELVLAPRDVLARLPELVARRDAPFSRPADVALHLLAAQAAKSVRVALSGDGGDEILGGYRRHTLLRNLPHGPRKTPGLYVIPVVPPKADADGGELRRILYYEQVSWLPDNLLERTDRMTMAASLETRAPFLDHRVAEYVSALPDNQRVSGLSTKVILRAAAKELLAGAHEPRKAGFRIPVGEMLRGEGRDLLMDHLRGPGSLTRAYYQPAVLDKVLDAHLAGKRNHEELLWTLLNLEIWHRTQLPTARRS